MAFLTVFKLKLSSSVILPLFVFIWRNWRKTTPTRKKTTEITVFQTFIYIENVWIKEKNSCELETNRGMVAMTSAMSMTSTSATSTMVVVMRST